MMRPMEPAADVAASAIDRRPLPARDRAVFVRSAQLLARMHVTPNAISALGLVAGVLSAIGLALTTAVEPGWATRASWLAAALLIQVRGACNILDGVLAMRWQRGSRVGVLYNEIPDRVSDAATLIGAGYALGGAAVLGWAAAVIAVFVSYVRVQCRLAGAPPDYCGPMAKPMRMVVVVVAAVFVMLAPDAWQWRWGPGDAWGVMAAALLLVIAGGLLTALRRIRHAAAHLRRAGP